MNLTTTIQTIPLSKIHPNPENPRRIITDEMIQAMMGSLKSAGLKNPIKVWECKTGAGEQRGTYELISGHIRFEAAKKLGWASIPALVLDLAPEEALLEAILDNRGQPMTWFELYHSIEALLKSQKDLTQTQIADQLEVDNAVVTRAKKVMGLLNEGARAKVFENLKIPGTYQVAENVIYRLCDLKDAQVLEKAVSVAIQSQMTEPEAAKLVAWVLQTGQEPSTYLDPKGTKAPLDDPKVALWEPLPPTIKVLKTPSGYLLRAHLKPSEAGPGVYGLMAALEQVKTEAHLGEPDARYSSVLPGLVAEAVQEALGEEGAKQAQAAQEKASADQREQEKAAREQQRNEARKQAQDQKAKAQADQQAAKAKARQEVQVAREAAQAQRLEVQEQRKAAKNGEVQAALDQQREAMRNRVEGCLGKGPVAESLLGYCWAGDKAQALKVARKAVEIALVDPEGRKAFCTGLEENLKQLITLMKKAGVAVKAKSPLRPSDNPKVGEPSHESQESRKGPSVEVPSTQGSGDLISTAKDLLQKKTGMNVEDLVTGVEKALIQDGKSAVNMVIKQGMRKAIKGLFK